MLLILVLNIFFWYCFFSFVNSYSCVVLYDNKKKFNLNTMQNLSIKQIQKDSINKEITHSKKKT